HTQYKRNGKTEGKIDCFMSFPFPQQFSLFTNAKIGHVEISKMLPLRINDTNLRQLSTLLHGCSIDKFTLFFDEISIHNLHLLPSFLARFHVKHVEFSLLSSTKDLIPHFVFGKFANSLVKSGVREVTFSGQTYRAIPNSRPSSVFDFLLVLFSAGITTISVLPHTLQFNGITAEPFEALTLNLAKLSRPLRLQLELGFDISLLNCGRRSMDGGFVDVNYSPHGYGQIITAEFTSEQQRNVQAITSDERPMKQCRIL
ncbi:hypothetical protein PMAYCL1PPCAC_22164, partial [Pristionchus mayeri]